MNKIKLARNERGISQQQLADIIGVSRSTIAMWETSGSQADNESLGMLAEFFDVSVDFLLGRTERPSKTGIKIPVLGKVQAGLPMTAVEYILDYEEISSEMALEGEHFALQIKGDSMEPRIKEGDVVIVRRQSTVDSGDVAIILVNGDDATCKKVIINTNGITLVPFNSAYDPLVFTKKEVLNLPVTVLGKVVELRAKF